MQKEKPKQEEQIKVRKQWTTNELENYTKDANMKRTKTLRT